MNFFLAPSKLPTSMPQNLVLDYMKIYHAIFFSLSGE